MVALRPKTAVSNACDGASQVTVRYMMYQLVPVVASDRPVTVTGCAHARRVSDLVRDGRSTRWDPHRRERRAAITAAAIAAIEQYGPDALTGQIAELAGVPRTHVYRHFEGKQALDRAVVRRAGREILARSGPV